MSDIVIAAMLTNMVYLLIWFYMNKARNSKNGFLKEWDNGNSFYELLSDEQKESYWKEDTNIVNIFFMIFLFFLEIVFIFLYIKSNYWIFAIIMGLAISIAICVFLSLKLKKKYR